MKKPMKLLAITLLALAALAINRAVQKADKKRKQDIYPPEKL